MIILIIMIILTISIIVGIKEYDIELGMLLFSALVAIPLIILVCLLLLYPYKITEKLEMYSQENENIEHKIKSTVQAYMNYEQETYKNLVETADLETLIIKYPELGSNELVKAEIETYKENNNKIKELKEEELTKDIVGWWLFFNIGM